MRSWFLLLLCLPLTAGVVVHAARDHNAAIRQKNAEIRRKRSQLKGRLSNIGQQKQAVQRQIQLAQARKRTWTEQLRDTQSQLRNTKNNIQRTEIRLMDTQRDLNGARRELVNVRQRLQNRNALLERRLVATQRHGAVPYAAVMLDAADYWDFLSRRRLMGRLVQYDVSLVKAIRADEHDVLRLQARLLSRQQQQKELVAMLATQRVRREALMDRQAEAVREAAREQAEAERQLAALHQASSEITIFLRRLVETPEGRARAATPYRGDWGMPVGGRMTSPFGMRMHPVLGRYKLHTGVDFGVPAGTPIRAAGNGVVVHAGWWGAYGNAVIIDHGGGTTTLYGHMSAVRCVSGQTVTRGAVIGTVGSTGLSTGPHCHFEVRRNGVPVNPLGAR